MSMLTCEEVTCENILKEYLLDPELWNRVSAGEHFPESFTPLLPAPAEWMGFWDKNLLVGLLLLTPETSVTCSAHINIQESHRRDYATKVAHAAFTYLVDVAGWDKVNAQVPSHHGDVMGYLTKHGFSVEGINRRSMVYKGGLVDQTMFGITRNEMASVLLRMDKALLNTWMEN